MKILIAISDSFCANFIKGQGKYLVDKGHEVIIVSGPGIEIDDLELNEPVKVIRVKFSREISPINDLKSLFTVIDIAKKEKPDIINAGNPKTGFLFSLAHIFFWKIPLIFTLRGVRSDTLQGSKRVIVKFTEYVTCRFADKVICISPSLKVHAEKIGIVDKKKCVVLTEGSSNGINLSHYSLSEKIVADRELLIKKYNIPEDAFLIAFVGRVTKDKGIVEIIDALNVCIKRGANMKLIIAGPIEHQDPIPEDYYLQLETNPNIIYVGKQLDVRPIYALAQTLVLYSYREGFGNVVIEASSFGVPSIVADIPGLKDTTIHMETGLIVEPRNTKELADAIFRLYNDMNLAVKLGENGKERVYKFFSNEVVWSAQHKLYEELHK